MSRPVGGKYSQLARRKVQRGPIGVYTTPRRAREGAGTSSYTFVPSHAFNACQHLRSSNLYRRPPLQLGKRPWCTDIVGQMGTMSDPGLPDPDEGPQPGADQASMACSGLQTK